MQFWTKEEFDAVIYAMTSKHYVVEVALKMLFGTGMRSGELLALTHNDIDFENKTISITKTHTRINGEDNIFPPKTPRSRRIIPISDTLVEILQDYINRLYDYDPEDRIFPFTKEALRYCMEKYSKKPGIKLIRLHDLRHSHASLLIDMGADVLLISQRLGHENMQTTLNRYSHLYPNKQAQLAVSLDVLMKEANQDMGSKRGAR